MCQNCKNYEKTCFPVFVKECKDFVKKDDEN